MVLSIKTVAERFDGLKVSSSKSSSSLSSGPNHKSRPAVKFVKLDGLDKEEEDKVNYFCSELMSRGRMLQYIQYV